MNLKIYSLKKKILELDRVDTRHGYLFLFPRSPPLPLPLFLLLSPSPKYKKCGQLEARRDREGPLGQCPGAQATWGVGVSPRPPFTGRRPLGSWGAGEPRLIYYKCGGRGEAAGALLAHCRPQLLQGRPGHSRAPTPSALAAASLPLPDFSREQSGTCAGGRGSHGAGWPRRRRRHGFLSVKFAGKPLVLEMDGIQWFPWCWINRRKQ